MKGKFLSAILLLILIVIFDSCKNNTATKDDKITTSISPNTLSDSEKQAGWQLLFDGKSTDQWRGYNRESFPTKGWFIDEEGNLAVTKSGTEEEGFGGDIITKRKV